MYRSYWCLEKGEALKCREVDIGDVGAFKHRVPVCALVKEDQMSGHSHIYRYLVSCITKQNKHVFRCLEKAACCLIQRHCGSDQNIFSVISPHTIF